ncbi:hypothetical protein [Actinokineospora sp.]|uniref:hypothetical protein n=1 Tax=Actinokineospora sp. TaxID=1872133 RepID=UPI004037C06A
MEYDGQNTFHVAVTPGGTTVPADVATAVAEFCPIGRRVAVDLLNHASVGGPIGSGLPPR